MNARAIKSRSKITAEAPLSAKQANGHFQKPLNLKPEFGRRILEDAVRVNA